METLPSEGQPATNACPCGTRRSLEECCGPIINGTLAATAETLMRARYTAFVTRQFGDFAYDSLAPEKHAEFDRREVEASAQEAEGLGLEIRAVDGGGPEDDTGTVEYVARFRIRGQIQVHHELATFRREDGRWLYADGQMNPKSAPRRVTKVGRNDPCSCGSGRKFKKCCGA
ncbi:MAG: YchJ family protein [Rhodospirillales bacterium]|nr:YchJ family protein [Rhodospirillales bacterium]